MIGETIGSYRITAKLGEGGMGEVHRATDTRLGREVAIKVAKEQFSERFEREARAIAALNHPNICQIYDVGPNYLVMELVEGTPLKGPLPLEKAIEYAGQILDALDAAHKKGITHRDLTPANILVTKQGIKLLDFGLAKQTAPLGEADVTRALTGQGQILGTLQYMSPEQLQGKEVDARSDLFSFGCVLYEMLTGKRAFEGQSPASVIAAILEREPAPLEVARPLDRVIQRSLAKDPDQRFHTARDLKAALSWVLEQPTATTLRQTRIKLPWAAWPRLLTVIFVGWLGWWRATRPVAPAPLMRLSVDLGPDAVAGQFTTTAISPDGARLVFPVKNPDGKQMLATRLLDETKHDIALGNRERKRPVLFAGWKMDRVFRRRKNEKDLGPGRCTRRVVRRALSARRELGEGRQYRRGIEHLKCTFARTCRRRNASAGHQAPGGALTHRWPQTLPGSEAVLFTLSSSIVAFEDASIEAVSLKTGEIKILVRGGYFGRYLPTGDATGHLVYVHEGVLFGVPFDPARLEVRGAAVPILEDLAADPSSGAGQFSFSGDSAPGTFVYRTGKVSAQSWPVLWLDQSGKTKPLIATPGFY